jgi:predicted transglutaminase-like cysteine proteinase
MSGDARFSSDLSAFTRWHGVMARFETQSSAQDSLTLRWRRLFSGLRGLPFTSMVRRVNDIMNARPYVSDWRVWQQSDYWATPGEFMQAGGDCEDYALAKYLALRSLGVPSGMMRIVIVHDMILRIPHAILLVRAPEAVYVLDNQNRAMRRAEDVHRYQPIYSINHDGWWFHQSPALARAA